MKPDTDWALQDLLPENVGFEINGISHRAERAKSEWILLSLESVEKCLGKLTEFGPFLSQMNVGDYKSRFSIEHIFSTQVKKTCIQSHTSLEA